MGVDYAAVLLDLVKAFERVPRDIPVRIAASLGYNLYLVRASLAAYRLSRTLQVEGACSKTVVAVRGVTAGAGHAVIELRVLLSDIWDRVHRLVRHVDLTVYVDDTGLEASGTHKLILSVLARAAQVVADGLRDVRMELSDTKCVVLVSTRGLAVEVAETRKGSIPLSVVVTAKSLGVDMAGGRRVATQVLKSRLTAFSARIPRFVAIRRMAVLSSLGPAARRP